MEGGLAQPALLGKTRPPECGLKALSLSPAPPQSLMAPVFSAVLEDSQPSVPALPSSFDGLNRNLETDGTTTALESARLPFAPPA